MSKFGEKTTAMEVIEGHDLTGYEVIVTGASSGIGIETVRAFAKANARVILTARDLKKGEEIAKEIREGTKNNKVEVEKLELDSLQSVRDFVQRYLAKKRPLNILVNNAGVMACPLSYTVDGFETQFGTNHMGHFCLTLGLLPALKEGAKVLGKKSRVVNVSSLAHIRSDVLFDDINFKKSAYDPWKAYGQSKTANVLFTLELNRLYENEGVVSNALMPGIIQTGLLKHIPKDNQMKMGALDETGKAKTGFFNKTVEQGASTQVWAAVEESLEGKGGLYLEDCQISRLTTPELAEKEKFGYLDYVMNKENATKLWKISMEWLQNPPK